MFEPDNPLNSLTLIPVLYQSHLFHVMQTLPFSSTGPCDDTDIHLQKLINASMVACYIFESQKLRGHVFTRLEIPPWVPDGAVLLLRRGPESFLPFFCSPELFPVSPPVRLRRT